MNCNPNKESMALSQTCGYVVFLTAPPFSQASQDAMGLCLLQSSQDVHKYSLENIHDAGRIRTCNYTCIQTKHKRLRFCRYNTIRLIWLALVNPLVPLAIAAGSNDGDAAR